MKPLCVLLVGVVAGWVASGVDWSREAVGQEQQVDTFTDREGTQTVVAPVAGRYEISAYGSPAGHGCYRVDTVTGNVWHIANGQPPKPVADDPLGFKANSGPTRIAAELRTPHGNRIVVQGEKVLVEGIYNTAAKFGPSIKLGAAQVYLVSQGSAEHWPDFDGRRVQVSGSLEHADAIIPDDESSAGAPPRLLLTTTPKSVRLSAPVK